MKKVNIQTHHLHQKNQKRKFGTFPVVEFNEKGVAQVTEEAAKYIVKNHEMITYEGEESPVKKVAEKPDDETSNNILVLKDKINSLEDKLISKDIDINRIKGEKAEAVNTLESYKALTNDLKKEISDLNATIDTLTQKKEKEPKNIPKEPQKEDTDEDTIIDEKDKEFRDGLVDTLTKKEMLKECEKFPEKEWKHFEKNNVTKTDVANYLTLKTKDSK